ncbi:mitochondrial thiamine pyrophosphate carrier-like [Brevipalpus obovatus]|uniref:mitochondrial thiamine pyrophosphate carrier-like n=1 Tax=Brevipalpus obovatus TaxID=246614 RepID=UPI003D9F7E89
MKMKIFNSEESVSKDLELVNFFAGFATRFLNQPFHVVKIRLQLQVEPIRLNRRSRFWGTNHCIKAMFKNEGFPSLWKGHTAAQVYFLVFSFTDFLSYSALDSLRNRTNLAPNVPWISIASGSFSSGLASLICMPIDNIHTKLVAQSEPKTVKSFFHGFKYIYQTNGISGFYRGTLPSFLHRVPMTGTMFGLSSFLESLWDKYEDHSIPRAILRRAREEELRIFLCGGSAGALTMLLVHPLDLARHRMQIQGFEAARKRLGKTFVCSGFIDCFVQTVRNEGFLGLYKGLWPNMFAAFLTMAYYNIFRERGIQYLVGRRDF